MIHETIVTTAALDGRPHTAPMGIQYDGDIVILKPFKPSLTLDNIVASGVAVVNATADVRVFAGCVTRSATDWPTVPGALAHTVRLADALSHIELRTAHYRDDDLRPVLRMDIVRREHHAPFIGFNRAQAAVIEGAILVSRLSMLPDDKVDNEMAYLQIAIDKTAGAAERMAWEWLTAAIARHRADARNGLAGAPR